MEGVSERGVKIQVGERFYVMLRDFVQEFDLKQWDGLPGLFISKGSTWVLFAALSRELEEEERCRIWLKARLFAGDIIVCFRKNNNKVDVLINIVVGPRRYQVTFNDVNDLKHVIFHSNKTRREITLYDVIRALRRFVDVSEYRRLLEASLQA